MASEKMHRYYCGVIKTICFISQQPATGLQTGRNPILWDLSVCFVAHHFHKFSSHLGGVTCSSFALWRMAPDKVIVNT